MYAFKGGVAFSKSVDSLVSQVGDAHKTYSAQLLQATELVHGHIRELCAIFRSALRKVARIEHD